MSYKKTNALGTVNNVSITGASVAGNGQRAYGGGSGSCKLLNHFVSLTQDLL